MSKLYDTFLYLKKEDNETIYMFKSGIFYIFLAEDAKLVSSIFNFKITNLNNQVIKCGFPISSYEKYLPIIEHLPYKFKIVDINDNMTMSLSDFKLNHKFETVFNKLKNIDTNNLSVSEAYNFINELRSDLGIQ